MPAKILVIEDEPMLLKVLKENFTNNGFTVITSENGLDGLSNAIEHHPDLILLDNLMPLMGGLAMMQKLRQDAWGKTARVIVLTNLSDHELSREYSLLGVDDYLTKSNLTLEDVNKIVANKLAAV